MERRAFARALRFLNYLPFAKWTALLASVGAGVVFVAFLALLALFADLMVNHGQVPAFPQLLTRAQHSYLHRGSEANVASNPRMETHLRQRFESLWKDAADGTRIDISDEQLAAIAGDETLRNNL